MSIKNSRAIPMFLCWISVAAAYGCGSHMGEGENAVGSCGKVVACGGDVTGTWKLTSACYVGVGVEQPTVGCPSATAALFVDDASGRLSFAKGNFTRALDLNGRTVITYPASCKTSSGQTRTCTDFAGAGATAGAVPGEKTTCTTAANGDCLCTMPMHASLGDSGAYTVDGTQLTTPTDTFDFCVKGNSLVVRPQVTSGPGGMTALLQSTLEKQ
jgi:hypothetical protein